MQTCTVEVGLLSKKPCGQPSVTHCVNCEQPLCSKHAVPEVGAAGRKTGKFLCKECAAAQRVHDKITPPAAEKPAAPAPAPAKKPAAAAKPAGAQPAAKEPPADGKPAGDGGIDFTPSKK